MGEDFYLKKRESRLMGKIGAVQGRRSKNPTEVKGGRRHEGKRTPAKNMSKGTVAGGGAPWGLAVGSAPAPPSSWSCNGSGFIFVKNDSCGPCFGDGSVARDGASSFNANWKTTKTITISSFPLSDALGARAWLGFVLGLTLSRLRRHSSTKARSIIFAWQASVASS